MNRFDAIILGDNVPYECLEAFISQHYGEQQYYTCIQTGSGRNIYILTLVDPDTISVPDEKLMAISCLDDHLDNTTEEVWDYLDQGCYKPQHIHSDIECYCAQDDCIALDILHQVYHGPSVIDVYSIRMNN